MLKSCIIPQRNAGFMVNLDHLTSIPVAISALNSPSSVIPATWFSDTRRFQSMVSNVRNIFPQNCLHIIARELDST